MAKWFGTNAPFYGGSTILGNTTRVAPRQEDFRLVRNDLLQGILTLRGERLFRPNFGGDIQRSLFEQNDDFGRSELEQRIRSQIENFHPRVVLSRVEVVPDSVNENVMIAEVYGTTDLDATNSEELLVRFQLPRSGSIDNG